jgi:GNAT superfamily N-acetyltransferase
MMREAFVIRGFQPEDYERMAEVNHWVDPRFSPTAEELRFDDDSLDRTKYILRRYVALEPGGERAIAFGDYAHTPQTFHPLKFYMDIEVDPPWQGRGAGSALWARMESDLRDFGAISVGTGTYEDRPAAVSFLMRRGFTETMRMWENHLRVSDADLTELGEQTERLKAEGISVSTLETESGRDPSCFSKLHGLYLSVMPDIPLPGAFTDVPLEEFLNRYVRRPGTPLDAFFIAKHGETYVGLSSLWREGNTSDLWQIITGVRKDYRRRGVALALKLNIIDYAKRHDAETIETWNASTNVAMLFLNEKLGYRRKVGWIFFEKSFSSPM